MVECSERSFGFFVEFAEDAGGLGEDGFFDGDDFVVFVVFVEAFFAHALFEAVGA